MKGLTENRMIYYPIFRHESVQRGFDDYHSVSSHQHRLWTPECFPILLPNLQRSKHIYRKTSGQLSLGFIPHYLFMQNERHCF